jgi:hypothetical protein
MDQEIVLSYKRDMMLSRTFALNENRVNFNPPSQPIAVKDIFLYKATVKNSIRARQPPDKIVVRFTHTIYSCSLAIHRTQTQ